MPFIITITIATSKYFVTLIACQINLIVLGPSNYRFTDYINLGIPLTVMVGILILLRAFISSTIFVLTSHMDRIKLLVQIMNNRVVYTVDDEIRYKIFKLLQTDSQMNQRALAEELGISLGKTNYCLKALISKGLIKMKNFSHSKNKLGYVYQLTPKGLEEKAKVTFRFLKWKIEEYETIQNEIDQLRKEVRNIENKATKEMI